MTRSQTRGTEPGSGGGPPHLGLTSAISFGVVTGSVLAYQAVLARLMSALVSYHFSFLAVSVAFLGAGVGVVVVHRDTARGRRPALGFWAGITGAAYLVAGVVIPLIDLDDAAGVHPGFVARLALVVALAMGPPIGAGVLTAAVLTRAGDTVSRWYAVDLLGAALGAALVVPLLSGPPAPLIIIALGVASSLAGASLAGASLAGASLAENPPTENPPAGGSRARGVPAGSSGRVLARVAVPVVGVALGILGTTTSALDAPPGFTPDPALRLVSDRWTPISRLLAYQQPKGTDDLLFYDRIFVLVPHGGARGARPTWKQLRLGPQSVGYEMSPPGPVFIIGGGGGRDVWNAFDAGRRDLTVAELNPAIIAAVEDDLGSGSRRPFSKVTMRYGDGRSELAREKRKFAQVQLSFTDTISSNAAAGYALNENFLYTSEAFEEYLDALTPNGVLSVTRQRRLLGEEALRLTVLAREAAERLDPVDPWAHIVVLRGHDVFDAEFETVLIKKTPWTEAELARLEVLAREKTDGVVISPAGAERGVWRDLFTAPSWRAWCAAQPLDLCPPTDDRPFFFNPTRLTGPPVAGSGFYYRGDPLRVLLVTTALLVAGAGVLLVPTIARGRRRGGRLGAWGWHMAGLGFGFLMVELVLTQRLVRYLGYPTATLSVVLASLLAFTGLGSAVAGRLPERTPRWVPAAVAGTVAAVWWMTAPPLLDATDHLSRPVRILVTLAVLAPLGLALGLPMALALRVLGRHGELAVTGAWAVNTLASVVASGAAVTISLLFGFRWTLTTAVLCYAAAAVAATLAPRSQPGTG